MNLTVPLLFRSRWSKFELPEIQSLAADRREAILEIATKSPEYQSFEASFATLPLFTAIVLGTTPFGTTFFLLREAGVLGPVSWTLLALGVALIGIILGRAARFFRNYLFAMVSIANFALFPAIFATSVSAALVALIVAAVIYEVVLSLGWWIFAAKTMRLLQSLVKQLADEQSLFADSPRPFDAAR